MKRNILFPFLFALYAVLNALLNNIGQLDPLQAIRPLIVLMAIAGTGFVLFYVLFKNWHYAGYLVFLVLAFFILFGHASYMLRGWQILKEGPIRLILLAGWSLIFLFLSWRKLWRWLKGKKYVTPALNLFVTLALILQLSFAVIEKIREQPLQMVQASTEATDIVDDIVLDCSNTPDIYYIILDGYGRQDVLEEQYKLDTSQFITSLNQRGFTVPSQSHSNYVQTIYSLSSSLNFQYINPEPKGKSGFYYFSDLIAENRITRVLEQCDYETIAFESGFFFTERPDVDEYLSDDNFRLNEIENLLLAGSPYEVLSDVLTSEPPEFSYESHHERVLFTIDELQNLPVNPRPTFVFAHIISPHPPFVFDERGNLVQPSRPYALNDGNEFDGNWKEYQSGYAKQVQYLNQRLLETVDTILSKSKTPPIIILQGDHGPGGSHDWRSPSKACLWERTGILNAYYLPGDDPMFLAQDISPVNSFRIILNHYFGTDLELLPNKTFFTSHRLERQVIEITTQRDSKRNCTLP